MFLFTVKVPRRSVAALWAMAALVGCCALAFSLGQARPAGASVLPDGRGIRTNRDRVDYLAACGWEVQPEPLAVVDLRVPETLEGRCGDYLALPQSQGFDRARCRGQRVRRYTYASTTYPTGETGVRADLLLRRGRVVGGEVFSLRADGFLHGLLGP